MREGRAGGGWAAGQQRERLGLLAQRGRGRGGGQRDAVGFHQAGAELGAPRSASPSAVSWWRSRDQARGVGWGCSPTGAPGLGGRAGLSRPAGKRLWDDGLCPGGQGGSHQPRPWRQEGGLGTSPSRVAAGDRAACPLRVAAWRRRTLGEGLSSTAPPPTPRLGREAALPRTEHSRVAGKGRIF